MTKLIWRRENLDRMDMTSVAERPAPWAFHHMQLAANVQDLSVCGASASITDFRAALDEIKLVKQ